MPLSLAMSLCCSPHSDIAGHGSTKPLSQRTRRVFWIAIATYQRSHLICTVAVYFKPGNLVPSTTLTSYLEDFLSQSLKCMLLSDNPKNYIHQRRHSVLRKTKVSINHPGAFTPESLQTYCFQHLLEKENIFRGFFPPCSSGFPCGSIHYPCQNPGNPPTISSLPYFPSALS